MPRENRTARLTILIDPDKKAVFEQLCTAEDVTPSQVIRRLIRAFIEERLGHPWQPGQKAAGRPSRPARQKSGTADERKHAR